VSIFGTVFVPVGIVKYMPQCLFIMQCKAVYYLWGDDQRLLGQWLRPGRLGGVGSQQESLTKCHTPD
jgi:hypothetical protein